MDEFLDDVKFKALTPACYGCTYCCVSSIFSCEHPLSVRLSYDGFTGRSYRFPSFDMCIRNKGLCKFYEPSETRGAEYSIMKEEEEQERIEKERDRIIQKVLGDRDKMTEEEFIEKITQVATPLDKEDDME